ncbi:MAG TPA: hypothetical protein VLW26_01600 [Steroidobacteraceae bacterium]|nr:hypothetical protein [Steroidobacteraceae bacterium]
MSSSDRTRGLPAAVRPDEVATPAAPAAPQDPYPNWLDRMQRARARHAAITKNLHTWTNYKSWADKVKDSWEDGDKS